MRIRYRFFSTITLMLWFTMYCSQAMPQCLKTKSLVQALLEVTKARHASIIVEALIPVSAKVVMPPSEGSTSAMIKFIVDQCPGYTFSSQGGTFVVLNSEVAKSSRSPLQTELRTYVIPWNLADFKLSFPNAVASARSGLSGVGGLISGITEGDDRSSPLTTAEVRNTSAKTILLRVAKETGDLFVVIFVQRLPKGASLPFTVRGWEIAGGKGLSTFRLPPQ